MTILCRENDSMIYSPKNTGIIASWTDWDSMEGDGYTLFKDPGSIILPVPYGSDLRPKPNCSDHDQLQLLVFENLEKVIENKPVIYIKRFGLNDIHCRNIKPEEAQDYFEHNKEGIFLNFSAKEIAEVIMPMFSKLR